MLTGIIHDRPSSSDDMIVIGMESMPVPVFLLISENSSEVIKTTVVREIISDGFNISNEIGISPGEGEPAVAADDGTGIRTAGKSIGRSSNAEPVVGVGMIIIEILEELVAGADIINGRSIAYEIVMEHEVMVSIGRSNNAINRSIEEITI